MILKIKKGVVNTPVCWSPRVTEHHEIYGFSGCRETCSGDMRNFVRDGNQDIDIPVSIGNINRRTSSYNMPVAYEKGLELLSYTLSELVMHQGKLNEEDRFMFFRSLIKKWWLFNVYVEGAHLGDLDSQIIISMDRVGSETGSVKDIPFNLLRYRPLASFLMAVPRAFHELYSEQWMYLGHAEPHHRKTGRGDKLWTSMYAGLGNAFYLYRYTQRYWWTFLRMLIENVYVENENRLFELMDDYNSCNGVRQFVREMKNEGYLSDDYKYYYDKLHNHNHSYFAHPINS